MLRVQSARSSIFINATFLPPLFEWQGVPARFFELVHRALTQRFAVHPRDFSVETGNSLSDVKAKYKIFGGASSVILSTDSLLIEFPNYLPGEYELASQIISLIDAEFHSSFSERQLSSYRFVVYEHAQAISGGSASEYLNRYTMPSVTNVCQGVGAIQTPTARFSIVSTEGSWRATCLVEASELVPNALFLEFSIELLQLTSDDTFDMRMSRIRQISSACLSALELERANAA